MILPLELLCQLVLAFESFKALKAAPAPRKRRKANEDGATSSVYAEGIRRRRIKTMAKAWIVLAVFLRVEKLLDLLLGWWLPLYSTFRCLAFIGFLCYHKKTSDIAYTAFIVPNLKPYEKPLDRIHAFITDILDILCWLAGLLAQQIASFLEFLFSPFRAIARYVQHLYTRIRRKAPTDTSPTEVDCDTSLTIQDMHKTPSRAKRKNKPRYSQIATPHVPGHLVAEEVAFPPVQPRLHPAERSLDDLPAFQEALDRAQAAFYEASSPHKRVEAVPEQDMPRHVETDNAHIDMQGDGVNSRPRRRKVESMLSPETDGTDISQKRRKVIKTTVIVQEKGSEQVKGLSEKALGKRRAVNQDEGDQTAASTSGIAAKPVRATRSTQVSASTSRLPQPRNARAATEEAKAVPTVTRSTQLARETALADRKKARDAAARKESQVPSGVVKRKRMS